MDRDLLTIGFVVALLFLLFCGIPIGATILALSAIGVLLVIKVDAATVIATAFVTQMTAWSLTALPLFVLMGEILGRGGVANSLFKSFAVLIGRMPGGLVQVNVLACALFSALCGPSTATVATIGKICYPHFQNTKYPKTMVLGSLAGAGTLGILIPPSVALILYGFTFEVSIGALFTAGILPGLMITLFFMAYIAITQRAMRWQVEEEPTTWSQKGLALLQLIPFVILIVAVFGSIYAGYATPTESAVVGVVGAGVLSALQRNLSWTTIRESLIATVMFSSAIALVLGASAALQVTMAFTGIPRTIVSWITSVQAGQYGTLAIIAVVLVVLGCFIDGLSMIVLTAAVLLPLVKAAGIDLLWFGVFMVILVEIGLITPPVGFNLFVLQRVSGRDLPYLAWSALPFLGILLLSLVLMVLFPSIVTLLPRGM